MQLQDLKHRIVRDLAWSLLSTPLFSTRSIASDSRYQSSNTDFPLAVFSDYVSEEYLPGDLHRWLTQLDKNPEKLQQAIEKRAQSRVGIYFEQLLGYFFAEHPQFDLIAKNLQIQGKNQTLGEFDFIVNDLASGKLLHIESAVKFYLDCKDKQPEITNNRFINNWGHWVGPNGKDTLSLKLCKMLKQQLPLKDSPITKKILLEKLINPERIESRLLLRGRFFRAINQESSPFFSTGGSSQYHWMSLKNVLEKNKTEKALLFVILPRLFWLAPLLHHDIRTSKLDCYSQKELTSELEAQQAKGIKSWHISLFEKNSTVEKERFFIIDDKPFSKQSAEAKP